ncbi:hypothetical protein SteCoe_19714 [Stentor coeruleus]|uniref:Ketoreductase domain-containing protein n=1 Tax=Stentor coeruleus TaxID=5963 RepID=A0A1R2BTN7_9CILI|nr:hypothetical protein SteCoe_19714 [Stentor coeruleus]
MSENLRFDGRVVVITGAGSGLGRAYALEFAKRGAKIVVNDLGGSVKGEGKSTRAADEVAEMVRNAGSVAAVNYDSVENGDKIIKTAIDAFGRVDIIINNAGILRDVSMLKMTSSDWDTIINVHLKGTFSVTKAAWKYFKDQGYGRIVNTSSGSGIYGNFGQANYGAAKMGIHGFTQVLAKEGEKYNIKANSICPVAASRMTQDLFTPELMELLVPEKIVPFVVCLCHESCKENGGLFEVAGGWFTRLRWQRAQGAFLKGKFTAEDVKKEWTKVNCFNGLNDYPTGTQDTIGKIISFSSENAKPKL